MFNLRVARSVVKMQWKCLLLCLLGALACSPSSAANVTRAARVSGATMLSVQDMADIKYIATVFDDGFLLGNGVIVNKYFIVVTYDLAAPMVDGDLSLVFVSAGYLVPLDAWTDDVHGLFRDVQEAYANPGFDSSINPLIKNVGLLRVCPSFPPEYYGQVPIAGGIANSDYRDLDTVLSYYQLEEEEVSGVLGMHVSHKNVAEKCECLYDTNDWWDSAYHVCVQYSDDVYAWDPSDKDGVIVTNEDNSEVLGILMTFENNWGEVALWLHQRDQRTWLEDAAVTAPHEYPPEP